MHFLSFFHWRILALVSLLVFALDARPQGVSSNSRCAEDFGISTTITPSLCQSDGSIAIRLTGNYSNYYNFHYSLVSTTAGGFSISPTSESVLTGIPAGTYNVSVVAVCKYDENTRVQKQFSNIVVPGNYTTIKASSNQEKSRATLEGCNTGRIALNVREGKGSESYVFTIVQGPSGFSVPQVVSPTKDGDVYTFPTNTYPAGSYRIEVSDGCYTAAVDHVVGIVTQRPSLRNQYSSMFTSNHPIAQYECSKLVFHNNAQDIMYSNYELRKYVIEQEFELSLTPAGVEPTVWHTFDFQGRRYELDIAPLKASDYYANNSLQMHLRSKTCPEFGHKFFVNVKRPSNGEHREVSEDCQTQKYGVVPYGNEDGIYCFPLQVTVRQGRSETSPVFATYTIHHHKEVPTVNLPFNSGTYRIEVQDAEKRFNRAYFHEPRRALAFATPTPLCDGYKEFVSPHDFSACLPLRIDICEEGTQPEKVVGSLHYSTKAGQYTPPLSYDKGYYYRVYLPDQTQEIYAVRRAHPNPARSLILTTSGSNGCYENWGDLLVQRSPVFSPGTTVQLTGPVGFVPKTSIHAATQTQGTSVIYLGPHSYTPPGRYTATITDECGTETVEFDHPGFHQVHDFTYTGELTCEGLIVRPSCRITNLGHTLTNRYYRVISGPKGGYDPAAISEGEKLKFTIEGTYQIGVMTAKSSSGCVLTTIPVHYKRPTIQLAQDYTSAYVCSEGDEQGHIIIKAQNGVEPYSYELYDANNQVKIDIPHTVEDNGAWHYLHGKANEVYTIRMQDACGNRFAQKITVVNLNFVLAAGARRKVVCAGEDIELLSLPFETYRWYAPDGTEISQEQNPILHNAKPSQSGLYRLVARSKPCGAEVEGVIDIKVLPCYAPVNPHLMNRSRPWQ